VLDDSAVRIGPIALAGLTETFATRTQFRQAMASARSLGGTPVIVAHAPDNVRWPAFDVPLYLTGHPLRTDRGRPVQLDQPAGREAELRPALSLRDCSRSVDHDRHRGLAPAMPIRIGAPPWMIRLVGEKDRGWR
jgi:hypothetical protein